MSDLQPSEDARRALEHSRAQREEMERFRAEVVEPEAQLLEGFIARNHFADKLKTLIYGRST